MARFWGLIPRVASPETPLRRARATWNAGLPRTFAGHGGEGRKLAFNIRDAWPEGA